MDPYDHMVLCRLSLVVSCSLLRFGRCCCDMLWLVAGIFLFEGCCCKIGSEIEVHTPIGR